MVKVEEVSLDHDDDVYTTDDDEYVTTDNEEDDDLVDDEYPPEEESLWDRISALKDIVPAARRSAIADKVDRACGWARRSTRVLGKAAWVVTTSALLLVFPLALEIEKEQALMAYEAELKLQQQGQQQILQPYQSPPSSGGKPTGIVPPGF